MRYSPAWLLFMCAISSKALYHRVICFVFPAIQDDERLSAEEMDERRRQNIAYEYLCHLEEAKR